MRFLYSLQYAFYRVFNFARVVFGAVPRVSGLSPLAYKAIHYGLVIAVAGLLAWFSTAMVPESNVDSTLSFVRRYYVGILFVLFYLFVRLLLFVIGLFYIEEIPEFEDIDRAWRAGLEGLARNGLDMQWLPVFAAVGLTEDEERHLFRAARMEWKVIAPSLEDRSAPLRFYASDEALFISLSGVGAMADQRARQRSPVPSMKGGDTTPRGALGVGSDTLQHGQLAAAGDTLPNPVAFAPAAQAGVTLLPEQRGGTLMPGQLGAARATPARPTVQKLSKEEMELSRRRLQYLCRLVSTERGQFCPLNGALQVVPLEWSNSAATQDLFLTTREDLQVLHEDLQQVFPIVCVYGGMENLDGFRDFLERGVRLDKRFVDSRAGSRFAAGAPVNDDSAKWVVEKCLHWFRGWIYTQFAKDIANPANRKLYQFLCDLDERRQRLVRQLLLSFGELKTEAVARLTGCYFAATGSGSQQQAFVHGVLLKLLGEQNEVSWNPERRRRDRLSKQMGLLLLVGAALVAAADAYLAWQLWSRMQG